MNIRILDQEQILNITATRGDTISFNFQIELDGVVQELSNLVFSVKASTDDTNYLFQRFLGNGITQSEEDNTIYTVNIEPRFTEDLDIGRYYYDLQATVNTSVVTVCKGILNLTFDVTVGSDVEDPEVTLADQLNGEVIEDSLTDKLEYAIESKSLMRSAIIEQGVEVSETATLRSYANAISAIAGAGKVYYDTTASWETQTSLVSEEGAIYIYNDYYNVDGEIVPNAKVGDGTTLLSALPFIDAKTAEHIADTTRHTTAEEKSTWNGHIANSVIHVTQNDKDTWNNHVDDTDIHVTATEKTNWNNHIADTDIHVTQSDKTSWNATGTELADLEDNIVDEIDKTTSSVSGFALIITDPAPNSFVKSLVANIEPQQASGTPTPATPIPISGWNGVNTVVCGKNLFNKNTVTNSKWLSTTTGLEENANNIYCVSDYIPVKNGVSYFVPATGSARKWLYDTNKNPLTYLSAYSGEAVTPSQDGYLRMTINIGTNDLNTIQVEKGSTATTYEPYNGTTTTLSWQTEAGTVYGGSIDITTGILTKTHENIASYNGESINEPWLSSKDEYTEGATPTTGAQVVYPLTTVVTYQLTPTAIKLLENNNTIFSDTGDTTLTYVVSDKYSKSGLPTVEAVKQYVMEMLGL